MDTKIEQGELDAEKQALAEVKEEEIRTEIINKYGFDETEDAERIDLLVQEKLEANKKLGQAIKAKINWREKAIKPKEDEKPTPTQQTPKAPELSIKDTIALSRANIPEEDIEEVIEFAHYKKISVVDALSHPVVQATLKDKEEKRKSAAVVSTNNNRVVKKVSSEQILRDAAEGKLPKAGTPEAEELFWANWEKKNGRKRPQ